MKERINITNYEAWMLDYVEGNLSDEQLAEFHAFMDKHPELYAELKEFDPDFVLPEEHVSFGDTLELKKSGDLPPVNLENYDDYFVRHIEGDLNEKEEASIATFVEAHPDKQKDLDLYKKTILPIESIAYPDKSELKKKDGKVIPIGRWVSVASAAAAVAVLLLWSPWNAEQTMNDGGQIAEYTERQSGDIVVQPPVADNDQFTISSKENVVDQQEKSSADQSTPSKVVMPAKREVMEPIASPAVALSTEQRSIITNVGTLYDPNMVTPINDLPDPQQDLAVTDPGSDDDYVNAGEFLRTKLLQGVENVTGKETTYEKKKESDYVATNFSFGGFEFNRTKKK